MINNTLAVVFPGQGSQAVGMLADLAPQFSEVKETFTLASDALGYDLWKLSQEGPAQELDKTEHTQPALLTASYAVWRILQIHGSLKPAVLAGHSLGEYTALVAAEALHFTDAVKLVAARGKYMQEAVAPGIGAMAAIIGLEEATVAEICREVASGSNEVLSPANFNSVGQVVIAGHKTLVERAMGVAKEKGAKLVLLIPVSVPSHCQLMLPAAKRLATLLADVRFHAPKIPIVNNVDVTRYTNEASIRDGLVRQLSMPVRWVETVQTFVREGITRLVECGPGKVLTGLNKRIDKNLQLISTADAESLTLFLKSEGKA